jgi:hypothetical protein
MRTQEAIMELPDYAELRRRAGVARAEEMRRLAALLRQFFRRAIRAVKRHDSGNRRGEYSRRHHGALRPVPVRSKRWPAPYAMPRDDYRR